MPEQLHKVYAWVYIKELPEVKTMNDSLLVSTYNEENYIITRYPLWGKLRRVTALLIRLAHNVKNPSDKITGWLSSNEIEKAMITICKIVQSDIFPLYITNLKAHKICLPSLQSLFSLLMGMDYLEW